MPKPATAPVMLPPSRPRQTTTAGRMFGLVPSRWMPEKNESCRRTATRPMATSRTRIFGVTITGCLR